MAVGFQQHYGLSYYCSYRPGCIALRRTSASATLTASRPTTAAVYTRLPVVLDHFGSSYAFTTRESGENFRCLPPTSYDVQDEAHLLEDLTLGGLMAPRLPSSTFSFLRRTAGVPPHGRSSGAAGLIFPACDSAIAVQTFVSVPNERVQSYA